MSFMQTKITLDTIITTSYWATGAMSTPAAAGYFAICTAVNLISQKIFNNLPYHDTSSRLMTWCGRCIVIWAAPHRLLGLSSDIASNLIGWDCFTGIISLLFAKNPSYPRFSY